MDVKEVELRGKLIGKAITNNDSSETFLKLLNDLKTGMKATEDLLRSTRIGVIVNRLKQHKDPQVTKLASELVAKWKDEVNREKRRAMAAGAKATNGTATPASSNTQSPAPAQPKKHTVPPEKRSHKTDNVDYKVTGDDTRNNCVRLIYDGLAFMSEELPSEIIIVATAVEKAVFSNTSREINDAYKTKIRALFQNLKNKSNPGLRKAVLSGEIPPERFVTMTHDEMKSAERRAEDERLEKDNMNKAMVAQVEKSISSTFTCGKCKQKKVSYSQAQTRSADEPMTTFCECMNCGNRWKFS